MVLNLRVIVTMTKMKVAGNSETATTVTAIDATVAVKIKALQAAFPLELAHYPTACPTFLLDLVSLTQEPVADDCNLPHLYA